MSTRGVIARAQGDAWAGRYHHFDAYPSGLGKALYDLYNGHFEQDIKTMMHVLIDEHPAGWSTIEDCDFLLAPGFDEEGYYGSGMTYDEYQKTERGRRPKCYCHGDRSEDEQFIRDIDDPMDLEWAYVINEQNTAMTIFCAHTGKWEVIKTIRLNGPEPDWKELRG